MTTKEITTLGICIKIIQWLGLRGVPGLVALQTGQKRVSAGADVWVRGYFTLLGFGIHFPQMKSWASFNWREASPCTVSLTKHLKRVVVGFWNGPFVVKSWLILWLT